MLLGVYLLIIWAMLEGEIEKWCGWCVWRCIEPGVSRDRVGFLVTMNEDEDEYGMNEWSAAWVGSK